MTFLFPIQSQNQEFLRFLFELFFCVLAELGLINGGANGGISNGKDMKFVCYHPDNQHVKISGIGNHIIKKRKLAAFC